MIGTVIQNTLMITGFVMVMMLLIEYVNAVSKNRWIRSVQQSGYKQILIAALLGIVPGCLGGFAAVSLFTHRVFHFGALVACMIASFGDEAFVMFAAIPETAIILTGTIFFIAVATGFAVHLLVKRFNAPFCTLPEAAYAAGRHRDSGRSWKRNLQNISFERAALMICVAALIVAVLAGWFDHSHAPGEHPEAVLSEQTHVHDSDRRPQSHGDATGVFLEEKWLNVLFVLASAIALWIVAAVPEHFLKNHLWGHIIKKHLPRIFLWTLGVLAVLQAGRYYLDIDQWVRGNQLYVMAIAVLVGLIPQSGPHIVFITLFAGGSIPFSVLLTNSIVQEGHAGLPLLAESRRGFLWMKAISAFVGLMVGFAGYFLHF